MSTPTTPIGKSGKGYPTPAGAGVGGHAPEPNFIGREDILHERWTTETCRPVRGEPHTDIANRVMVSPDTDDELARVIRAHEMIHAKVSPTPEQMEVWIGREIASLPAMVAVEELRVNTLAQTAGFDVKTHLSDGSELASGERCAGSGDWPGAVAMCIGTAGTAGHKQFLNGVRRHNRAWGDALADIGKRALREMRKSAKYGNLAGTDAVDVGGASLSPSGFVHTERIAEWVDRLAGFPPPTERKRPEGEGNPDPDGEAKPRGRGRPKGGDRSGNPHGRVNPTEVGYGARWADLRVSREPMPRINTGNLGKKRIATNVGKSPRRLSRYMTDPTRRVFDRVVRGSGGMVIIDASGSMSFTTEQIAEITEHSPGCTVAIYSDGSDDAPNFWVIADKGRMVETVDYIDYGHGNGVDYPAIVWGVENRGKKGAPLVWVTDGGVFGYGDQGSDLLTLQCVEYAKKHGYIVVRNVHEAIEQLRTLATGGRARSHWPHNFQEVYRRYNGVGLDA